MLKEIFFTCLFIYFFVMISEDDQFHHLEERIVLESEAGLNIYHEATLGLQFLTSFPHSNKSTYI